jgi:hypothetical protein
MRHKKQNGVEPEPERLWTKEDLVRAINERVSNNVVSDEKVRVSTDFVWRALSTQQRCELLGDWFIRQATMMKHRQEEKLDAVIDGEIVNA